MAYFLRKVIHMTNRASPHRLNVWQEQRWWRNKALHCRIVFQHCLPFRSVKPMEKLRSCMELDLELELEGGLGSVISAPRL